MRCDQGDGGVDDVVAASTPTEELRWADTRGAIAVSPDGTRFVGRAGEGTTYGPLAARDLRTGAEIVELEGLRTWDASSPLPPDRQKE